MKSTTGVDGGQEEFEENHEIRPHLQNHLIAVAVCHVTRFCKLNTTPKNVSPPDLPSTRRQARSSRCHNRLSIINPLNWRNIQPQRDCLHRNPSSTIHSEHRHQQSATALILFRSPCPAIPPDFRVDSDGIASPDFIECKDAESIPL
jgi:hypothetical protein